MFPAGKWQIVAGKDRYMGQMDFISRGLTDFDYVDAAFEVLYAKESMAFAGSNPDTGNLGVTTWKQNNLVGGTGVGTYNIQESS